MPPSAPPSQYPSKGPPCRRTVWDECGPLTFNAAYTVAVERARKLTASRHPRPAPAEQELVRRLHCPVSPDSGDNEALNTADCPDGYRLTAPDTGSPGEAPRSTVPGDGEKPR